MEGVDGAAKDPCDEGRKLGGENKKRRGGLGAEVSSRL